LVLLYQNLNHEIFNTWLTLTNLENGSYKITGYIKVSCFIIKSTDEFPTHQFKELSDNNVYNEEEIQSEQIKLIRAPNVI